MFKQNLSVSQQKNYFQLRTILITKNSYNLSKNSKQLNTKKTSNKNESKKIKIIEYQQ